MILAVDPGKTTGWASYVPGEPLSETESHFSAGELGLQAFLERADERLTEGDEVVCERFTISKRTLTAAADAHWAMKGIGVLEYWCTTRGLKFTLQTPAEAKGFATNEKLKAIGWYTATTGGHANDGVRHLLTYMVRNVRDQAFLRQLMPLMDE